MILCAGAASTRVIQEAALLQVHQIVASRRQVGETRPGYTGYNSYQFAEVVRELSGGKTLVARDHGGPYQNGDPDDDWERAFDIDVNAGFDVLHIDVCKFDQGSQVTELQRLCKRYAKSADIEVGGERDRQVWLSMLLESVQGICRPSAAVAQLGGHIQADRQKGALIPRDRAQGIMQAYAAVGTGTKAHNLDWMPGRRTAYPALPNLLYNIAPELGNVEVDAWLHVLPYAEGQEILGFAYRSGAWKRWFSGTEGTFFERARAALRYHLNSPEVTTVLDRHPDGDAYVRGMIRDAIQCG